MTGTITITDADLETVADEIEMWPYARAPRLFDLDYAAAVSAAISGREGELDSWHELAAWASDVAIAYWLLMFEHSNPAYVVTIEAKLQEMQFEAGGGLRGTMKRDGLAGVDAEDYEGALECLRVIRILQGDRE